MIFGFHIKVTHTGINVEQNGVKLKLRNYYVFFDLSFTTTNMDLKLQSLKHTNYKFKK